MQPLTYKSMELHNTCKYNYSINTSFSIVYQLINVKNQTL